MATAYVKSSPSAKPVAVELEKLGSDADTAESAILKTGHTNGEVAFNHRVFMFVDGTLFAVGTLTKDWAHKDSHENVELID